jgi:DNA polymerase III delta subunit
VGNAVNLVVGYVGQTEQVCVNDVITACSDVSEETVWALTDAIAASDTEKALRTLRQLLDYGKSPDEIMGTINWLLDSAYRASPDTSLTLRSKFVEEKVRPLVRKLGLARLKRAFALCTDTHFMMRTTGVDRELAIELLVLKLAAPTRAAAARTAARR